MAAANSECYAITSDAFGMYAWRLTQQSSNWAAFLTVYDSTDAQVYNAYASYGFGTLQLKGGQTYRFEVSGDPGSAPSGYELGVFEIAGSPGCASTSSTGFSSTPITGLFTDGSEVNCRQLTDPTSSLVHLSVQSQDVSVAAAVFDAKGTTVCNLSLSASAVDCRLTGTAPFRMTTRSASSSGMSGSYKLWADEITAGTGCTNGSLTTWFSTPDVVRERGASAAECTIVTSGAFGKYVMRYTQDNPGWSGTYSIYEPNGALVFQSSSTYATFDLKAGLNYRIIAAGDPNGYPPGYDLALAQVNGSTGCASVSSTDWNSAGSSVSLPTGQELGCVQLTDPTGSMLRLSLDSTVMYGEVFNAGGSSICVLYPYAAVTDCRLSGAGPFRAILRSGYDVGAHEATTAILSAYNIASTVGCVSASLGTWGQALPASLSRSTRTADCAVVTSGAFGQYLLRYSQDNADWHGSVTIYEPTGAQAYSLSNTPYTQVQLKGNVAYRLVFTGDTNGYPPGVNFGMFEISGSGACAPVNDVSWNAQATVVPFAGGSELDCRQLPGLAGTVLRIALPQAANSATAWGVVYAAGGVQVCTVYYGQANLCSLTGAAPYRLITRIGYGIGDAAPTAQGLWVNDLSSTTGCSSSASTTAVSAPAMFGQMNPGRVGSCWTVSLAREDRAWMSLVSTTSSRLHATLFAASGQSLCELDSGTSHAECSLTAQGPYLVLVTGPDDDSRYRIAVRRLNDAAGCTHVDSVASGIGELNGNLADTDQLACVRFPAAVGDQMNFTAVNASLPGTPAQNVDVYDPAGSAICNPRPWQGSPQCTFAQTGEHVAVISEASGSGRFSFSSTCVNPACGPDVFTLAGVSPAQVGGGQAVTVSVLGKALSTAQSVSLVRGATRLAGTALTVSADGRQLLVSFNLSTASVGVYDVVVNSPTEGALTATAALTIAGVRPAQLEAGLVTLGRFVANRPQTLSVTVKNTGNVDALGAPLVLQGLPTGSVITPKFDLIGTGSADDSVHQSTWSPQRSVYTTSAGTLGVPLFIGRIPAGGSHQYDFSVTVPVAANYTIDALTSDCMFTSTMPTASGLNLAGSDTFGSGGCTDAAIDLGTDFVTSLVPGSACVGLAASAALAISRNVVNKAPPFEAASTSDMFWSALNGVSCVASVIPGGQILSGILGGLSTIKDVVSVGTKCFFGPTAQQNSVASLDPNELVGPAGGGPSHAVPASGVHTFAVYFENAATATAPAQEVRVVDHIDPNQYDLSTVRFGAVQFGTRRWTPDSETASLNHILDLGGDSGLQLEITASTTQQGQIRWDLRTEDILTGLLPEDPARGFLPPDLDGTQGQGVLYFSVQPKQVVDGTVLSSQADVTFDLNPIIQTNVWKNVADSTPPTATAAAPTSTTSTSFAVSWNGSDATSGIAGFDVLVAKDTGPYTMWKQGVAAGKANYVGVAGHVYHFSAVGHDIAGNVSLLPPMPHANTSVRDATLLSTGSSATVRYGSSLVATTTIKDAVSHAAIAGVTVTLYRRLSATAPWSAVASRTTSSTGTASVTLIPTGYLQLQWRFVANSLHESATSAVQTVSVIQVVYVYSTRTTVVHGTSFKIYGTNKPSGVNQAIYLQRLVGTSWKTVSGATLRSQKLPNGVTTVGYAFSVTPSVAGTFKYRVYKPATSTLSAGYSSAVAVKVT